MKTIQIPANATPATDALQHHDDLSELTFRVLSRDGIKVGRYADPLDAAELDLLPSKAAQVAREDAGLLFLYTEEAGA